MNNYDFGNYICELRTKQKTSQAELAELLGVTNKAVSKWENGAAYPSSKLMYPLAKALGVSIEDLYSAMSRNNKKRNAARRVLDGLFGNKKLSFFIPLSVALLLYIVFAIFGESPDKGTLMVMAPIVSVVASCGMFLVIFVQIKNPLCPGWFIDLFEMLLLTLIVLTAPVQMISFLMDIKNGYTVPVFLDMALLCMLSVAHNKRTK